MSFLDIKDRPASEADLRDAADPYAQQQALLELLNRAHAHNAKILLDHGYPCPASLDGLRTNVEIAEPKALEAARMIDAIGEVWRALFRDDKAALANAALWLGLVMGPESFRKYQRRNRQGKRGPHALELDRQGRAAYDKLRANHRPITAVSLCMAMRAAGLHVTESQARRLLTAFKRAQS